MTKAKNDQQCAVEDCRCTAGFKYLAGRNVCDACRKAKGHHGGGCIVEGSAHVVSVTGMAGGV